MNGWPFSTISIHTFEGILRGKGEKQFPRGDKLEKGAVLEGNNYKLEFAWWDWSVERKRWNEINTCK